MTNEQNGFSLHPSSLAVSRIETALEGVGSPFSSSAIASRMSIWPGSSGILGRRLVRQEGCRHLPQHGLLGLHVDHEGPVVLARHDHVGVFDAVPAVLHPD